MTPPLRIGIVGCGYATRTRHLPAIGRISEVEVVALADVDRAALAEVAARWGVPRRYEDPAGLVGDADVEAVAVCVPAADHVEVALAALEAGRHVLVEKPLALSLHEADRLIERAGATSAKVLVGFNLRWHRLVRQARAVLRGGQLGRVHAVRAVFSDPIFSRSDLPAWRRERLLGGGSLLDKGVHHFDLVRFLLEDEVEQVAAWSSAGRGDDETVAVGGKTSGGALLATLIMDSATVSNELTLYGDSGTIHLDLYRADGFELRSLDDVPGAPRTRLRRIASSLEQVAGNVREVARGGVFDSAYDAEWRHFARAVRLGLEPECTLDDGRRALQIALAVAESAALGRPVDVADAPASVADVGSQTPELR
jgi:predicted dehydrogenase